MHIFPEDVEKALLQEIVEDGFICRHKFTELLDAYQFLPLKVKKDKNKSENLYFIMNSNMRGQYESKEEMI